MFAIRVELLTGTYRASTFDDRRVAEWPPHPARIFYAAVAALYDDPPADDDERQALLWWEGLGAPELHLGPIAPSAFDRSWLTRDVVDHYVPGNYATSWTRDVEGDWQSLRDNASVSTDDDTPVGRRAARDAARARTRLLNNVGRLTSARASDSAAQAAKVAELLPDHRNRQPRHFPVVRPDHPVFHLAWPDADAGTNGAVLDRVIARVARIGHSTSAVSCGVVEAVPSPATLVPRERGSWSLRTVASGVLDVLNTDFARHEGNTARVLPAILTDYDIATSVPARRIRPNNDAEWVVLTLPRGQKLHAPRSLDLTMAIRAALVRHAPEPVAPFISGHQPGAFPTPPITGAHVGAIPLIDVAHAHSDGAIHGVALVIPPAAASADRDALTAALAQWRIAGEGDLPVTLPGGVLRSLTVTQDRSRRTGRGALMVAERRFWSSPSAEWASVTPFATDRHPKAKPHSDAYASQMEQVVRRACATIGLPEPVDVTVGSESAWAAAPAVIGRNRHSGRRQVHGFPQFRTRSGSARHTVHIAVRFSEPVEGPIVIGAGRFYGYGLLQPVHSTGRGER